MVWNKKPDITLTWEWPDGRESEFQIIVTIDSIKPQSKGLLGINNSPSVIGWMPDGVELRGKISSSDTELSGKIITLVLPKEEVEDTEMGDFLLLGIIDDEVCIEASKSVS